ncbi:adenosylcobinamide-phosphate synthase [Dysgonomonas alginatilytica]|uniref:Cobalamin biosynthesis protein CobD n=1 Tax=Dysgonomonas alginatilytica TaxID=1605892 RepID=A0A2V3PMA4_9BACT|nr:adenosylcobinamide-phosphate synthase CbiB [Dysgonomonas alginatilytica]PXV61962.1 adenosylcobinamide-phosphate synthase [Dysgonomonas alginatilytica]
MDKTLFLIIPLIIGWIADRLVGDPASLPHPIVAFGKIIAKGEKLLNKNKSGIFKGAAFSVSLIIITFCIFHFTDKGLTSINPYLAIGFNAIMVFFCLAGKTLADEVRNVFIATDKSTEDGRKQVARIVGRDTSQLSPQQIRTAALETLSENLSDGVIAPLFWYLLLGVPGMVAYKMINTLDSMIGYKNERYKDFGCWAAHIDDIVNYIPARLTALLMLIVSGRLPLLSFVIRYGSQHASPNSGYPEAALAGILDCRFGGPNHYFGQLVEKPYIGTTDRAIITEDMQLAVSINQRTEILMILIIIVLSITNIFPLLNLNLS